MAGPSDYVKGWIKYTARRWASNNWFELFNKMHDGDSAKKVFERAFKAGAEYGVMLTEREFVHDSHGTDKRLAPRPKEYQDVNP